MTSDPLPDPVTTAALPSIDPERTRMRQLASAVGSGLDRWIATDVDPDARATRARFDQLVELMRLGPEPEARACPACGAVGMLRATRCGHCWALTPPPPLP